MNKKALLVVNGELPSAKLLADLREETKFVICTDGAARKLKERNIIPDVVIGDLDSLSLSEREYYEKKSNIIKKPSQYETDFEKALNYLEENCFGEVLLTGIKGERFDHAFSNTSIFAKNGDRFVFKLFDDDGFGLVLNGGNRNLELEIQKGTTVSLLALPCAEGIATKGLLYPLKNETLRFGEREGQSNEASEDIVSVTIKKGKLLVFILSPFHVAGH